MSDTNGALISRAKVTLTNTATNVKQETETNPEGLYIFANIGAGNYEITVENQGFRKSVRKITVRQRPAGSMQVGAAVGARARASAPLNAPLDIVPRRPRRRSSIAADRRHYDLVGLHPAPATPAR